jgi:alanyl-tRNA synthetase
MGQAYPELHRAEALISETLRLEETRFRKTLERGLTILDEETRGLKKGDRLKGEIAFTLYDTFGFPLDLTQDALKPRGIGVDLAAFNAAMERQRDTARASWAGSGEAATRRMGRPSFSAMKPSAPKASCRRWCATARKWPRSSLAKPAPSS